MLLFVILSSLAIFLLGILLLRREGLMRDTGRTVLCLVLMAAAVLLRVYLFDYESLDYKDFLKVWIAFFRDNGGFAALGRSVGNYNPPYLYFLALFSYFNIDGLVHIKLLSVVFDVLLAWAAMKLCSVFVKGDRLIVCFFAVLFLPTVVLNGAFWGQCDSIYAFFAVMGIYLALSDRPVGSMLCAAASLAFKLQAVFFLPVYFVLLLARKIRVKHLFVFPAAYILYLMPAVIAGRPFLETMTLYVSQAGTVGDALNYNAPSLTSMLSFAGDPAGVSGRLIVLAFAFTLLLCCIAVLCRDRLSPRVVLCFALLFCIGIPYLLPHMHDRYFFIAGILLLVLGIAEPLTVPAALSAELASLHCYCAYFAKRYFVHPGWGGLLMLLALTVCAVCLAVFLKKIKKNQISS